MKTLIIGQGQVGTALAKVLVDYSPVCIDIDDVAKGSFDIMHITFGYSDKFEREVKKYQAKYKPKYTVIHSTVPVGTSRRLSAFHSPIIGIHPHLAQSIKTFYKYLSGEGASELADYFRRAGCKVYLYDEQETTELLKISQTTIYALNIEYVKELKRQCDKYGLSFSEVHTIPTINYNEGYATLGMPEVKLPNLIPIMKKQGGHCTINNCELWDTDFTRFIKEQNLK